MKKLFISIALLLMVLTLTINANKTTVKTYTDTQECEKCGKDGTGGAKCAPGKCGKSK